MTKGNILLESLFFTTDAKCDMVQKIVAIGQYGNTVICTKKIHATANDTRPANLVASDLQRAIW